jgi:hypothetical protein
MSQNRIRDAINPKENRIELRININRIKNFAVR